MPGFNIMAPFITKVHQITIRPTTDILDQIIAITKDGISNTFNDVQASKNVFISASILRKNSDLRVKHKI